MICINNIQYKCIIVNSWSPYRSEPLNLVCILLCHRMFKKVGKIIMDCLQVSLQGNQIVGFLFPYHLHR